jgi:hypothetical protein
LQPIGCLWSCAGINAAVFTQDQWALRRNALNEY